MFKISFLLIAEHLYIDKSLRLGLFDHYPSEEEMKKALDDYTDNGQWYILKIEKRYRLKEE